MTDSSIDKISFTILQATLPGRQPHTNHHLTRWSPYTNLAKATSSEGSFSQGNHGVFHIYVC